MDYSIIQIDPHTWRIEDAGVRFFLLTGSERGLLIDSGMCVKNAREIAASLTDLPVSLLNTHADPDHIGSNAEFDSFYMHPAEFTNFHRKMKESGTILPVWEGQEIDLGDRPLRIIAMPGHTPGSIAVLDVNNRILISGDPIQKNGRIYMFGPQRDLLAYYYSLCRLSGMKDQFDWIYPSHGEFPVAPSVIDELIAGTKEVMDGNVVPLTTSCHDIPVKEFPAGPSTLLCDISVAGKQER